MDVDELDIGIEPSVVAKPNVQLLPKIMNGGIAGIVGVSCVFPLDLVKTRLQSQKGTSKYTGILDCFHKTIAQAGPTRFQQYQSLYQGASVNIILITPEKAIKLVANDVFRHALKKDNESLSNIRGMAAGACAGFCQIIITTPMELLKIRMQQATKRVSARKLVIDFLKTDGLRGLYKGLRPTMARDVTFSAIYFPLFAELDSWGPRKKDNSGDAVFWASFLSGLSAGAIASFSVTPLDVIKTRLQSVTAADNSIWTTFKSILSTEGPFALFKGAMCRMMVMAPLFGIAQTVYYIGVAEKLLQREKSQRMVCFETLAVEIDCAPKILFIGGGNMAEAIIDGCIKSGFLKHDQVAVTTRTEASANKWLKKGIAQVSTTNSEIINKLGSCIIVLAVKPHLRQDVFNDLANARLAGVPLIISLMAGIKTVALEQELAEVGYKRHVLRLMPNTPASISAGSTLLARSHSVAPPLIQLTKKLAESVGLCTEVDERYYNAAAAISGCGPAWAFMFIESLADGGVVAGVPRNEAMKLAAQTVMGAAKLVLETGEHPGVLKDRVCSPGGTTIAGVRKLESAGFRSAVIEAVKAAADKADQM